MGSRGAKAAGRKTRSDKKRDISPTISAELRDCIYRLSFITNKPVKDVAEAICLNGLKRRKVLEYLSQYFRRPVRVDPTLYRGNSEGPSVGQREHVGKTKRIAIRFKAQDHAVIAALAFAMDCTVSRSCAVLLDASVRDGDFINEFVQQYLEENLDAERVTELKKILRYVNTNNPYGEEYTWASLLSLMINEVREVTAKVADAATDFIVKNWRDK